jgi:hypothetical protein
MRLAPRESVIVKPAMMLKDHFLTRAFESWRNTDVLAHGSSAVGCKRVLVVALTIGWLLIMLVQIIGAACLVNDEAQNWAPSASGRWRQELFIQKVSFALLQTGFLLIMTREHMPKSLQHVVYFIVQFASGIGSFVLLALNVVMASAGAITLAVLTIGLLIIYFATMFAFLQTIGQKTSANYQRKQSQKGFIVRKSFRFNNCYVSTPWRRFVATFLFGLFCGIGILQIIRMMLGVGTSLNGFRGGPRTVCVADDDDIDCSATL